MKKQTLISHNPHLHPRMTLTGSSHLPATAEESKDTGAFQ